MQKGPGCRLQKWNFRPVVTEMPVYKPEVNKMVRLLLYQNEKF